jgi:prepilin-type N-terminal cleavage/methylation domain-containing protein
MKNSSFKALRQQGFSMVELLVVVAIIGIFSLVTIPNFMAMRRSANFKASMRNFTTILRNARQIAIAKNRRVRVSYATGTTANTFLVEEESPAATWTQVGPIHNLDTSSYFDATSTFPASADATKQEIYFYNNGTMLAADASAVSPTPVVVIRTPAQITFSQYSLQINNTGRVAVTGSKWN